MTKRQRRALRLWLGVGVAVALVGVAGLAPRSLSDAAWQAIATITSEVLGEDQ